MDATFGVLVSRVLQELELAVVVLLLEAEHQLVVSRDVPDDAPVAHQVVARADGHLHDRVIGDVSVGPVWELSA